jgi:transcription elongation factor S-II
MRARLALLVHDDLFAENLERGIFNFAIEEATAKRVIKKWDKPQFVCIYMDRMRSIWSNLRSPALLAQIAAREITPQALAFATHQELAPDMWRPLVEKKIARDKSKLSTEAHATTDFFTCKKCRSKKCSHYELQTRSADEPMTIFITCLECGTHWRQ